MTVRVRFAPSPTGYLHVGGARTALFNWLFARGHGGSFILRSDDTDTARSTPEFQADILESMAWLGLDWDEGIEVGGPHEPYRQSERLVRYGAVVDELLAARSAYRCFCTPEELDERRKQAMADGRPPGYDGRCRLLEPEEAAARVEERSSVRLAVPRPGETVFVDVVRDEVRFDHANVDDFVILRSNGMPTYHLASSVDDVDFGITHVVRGEDLLSSTPKHILIGQALGAPDITYAHLSLLQGPDGRKLSKRHGDTAIQSYRTAGFLPEAMRNYLALLGWSPGDDDTVISLSEMVDRFDLESVSKNPAIFDTKKLEWMNGVYIRDLPEDVFVERTIPGVEALVGRALDDDELQKYREIAPHVQERAKLLDEVAEQVLFLFIDEVTYDESSWNKVMTTPEARTAVDGALGRLGELEVWSIESVETALRGMLEEFGLSARKGLQPLRVAISGSSVSPPLFESIAVLGRDAAMERLQAAFGRL